MATAASCCARLATPWACSRSARAWYVPGPMEEKALDGDLVRAIADRGTGGREAEVELCRRFGPRIRLYGLRHLRDQDRARDLVQSVLLAVLEAARAGRIAEPERADRFMLGTCRNVAQRMREGDARQGSDAGLDELAAPEVEHETVDLGALLRCLALLDERGRRIVTLSFREERRSAEIAGLLATTEGNVRVLRHRAVASLRRCLDGQEEASE